MRYIGLLVPVQVYPLEAVLLPAVAACCMHAALSSFIREQEPQIHCKACERLLVLSLRK